MKTTLEKIETKRFFFDAPEYPRLKKFIGTECIVYFYAEEKGICIVGDGYLKEGIQCDNWIMKYFIDLSEGERVTLVNI